MCEPLSMGVLYVREYSGKLLFFYPDRRKVPTDGISFHRQNIACISPTIGNLGEPDFLSGEDSAQKGDRPATDGDVKDLVRRWLDRPVLIERWVEKVMLNHPNLRIEEKRRIARIAGNPAIRAGW